MEGRKMNIQQAKEEIINTVKIYTAKDREGHYRIPPVHQRPLLLIGPPGIGKTAIVRQAAEECGVGLVAYTITHHTRQSAVGLPVIREKDYQGRQVQVTEYTMSEIIASVYECMENQQVQEGILFIDEINCVSETLAPTMLQFLQNKTFGTHRVPRGWIIVAAGNPPEYNKSAKTFDIVTPGPGEKHSGRDRLSGLETVRVRGGDSWGGSGLSVRKAAEFLLHRTGPGRTGNL